MTEMVGEFEDFKFDLLEITSLLLKHLSKSRQYNFIEIYTWVWLI